MKKLLALTLVVALVGLCGTAQAAKSWDDMSWWGNTGATPEPQPESGTCPAQVGRTGYWWWPVEPASNVDDGELWGNRGIVYHAWEKPAPKVEEPKPEPPKPQPPKVVRTAPVLNNVLFDFDKAVLKPEGKAEVDKLVAEMKKFPKDTVVVEGHTCTVGDESYNMGLGQRRADSVQKYMLESGIDAARVQTVSFGETKPAVPNDTPANRKLNRRAEFKVTVVN
ncbi:MAG: OmpA family protein [Candidatus Hydrogenedens sp.]|nr:OmpA family protein [Candidatus Hydrogenedentota bacterium]NLF56788.1 OmpA family protein [Candidatus Hydrogenedens sp.]